MANRLPKTLRNVGVRVYALAILVVVLWTGYAAGGYLIQTVFYPIQIPDEFVHTQTQLTVDTLSERKSATVAGAQGRAPMAHYHKVDRWYPPDPREGCSSSGCHGPLPHMRSPATRAFANFHSTFLTCVMCHASSDVHPMPTTWMNLATGRNQDTPALLQLLRHLEENQNANGQDPQAIHDTIIDLLGQTLSTVGEDATLKYLLVEIDTSEPGSPVWERAVARLNEELPGHARGEYGAKLTLEITEMEKRKRKSESDKLTAAFHASPDESSERQELQDRIHEGVLSKPNGCLWCHGSDPSRLNYEALGYSPDRASFLRHIPVARQMESIRQGRPFHLPRFLEP